MLGSEVQTVYVVEEQGATFTFGETELGERARSTAEEHYQSEAAGGAHELTLFRVLAPARLTGDDLAEWCASYAEPLEVK